MDDYTVEEAVENIAALGNLIANAEYGDLAEGTLARTGLMIQEECARLRRLLDLIDRQD